MIVALLVLPVAPAAAAAPSAWQAGVMEACSPFAEALAPGSDLDALKERLRQAQGKADPFALEGACRGWRRVALDDASNAAMQLDWASQVGAALLWLGRSAQAQTLLEGVYSDTSRAGTTQAAQAGSVAALLSFIHVQRGQTERALEWSERGLEALNLAGEGATPGDRLRAQINHGSLLSGMRRFAEAEAVLRRTLGEALQAPDSLAAEAAAAMGGLAVLARRQSRYADALQEVEREIAWRRQHVENDQVTLVNALQNRGVLFTQLARYDEAEAGYREAIEQAAGARRGEGIDFFGHLSSLHESLSTLLLLRGRAAEARDEASEAQRLMASRPEARSPRGARPWRRLAEARLALGDLAGGAADLRQALELLKTGSGAAEADTLQAVRLAYARAMLEIGDLDEAAAVLQQTAAEPRPMSPEERARLASLQAVLAQRRGDLGAALTALQAADAALGASLPVQHPQRLIVLAQQCELSREPCAQLEQLLAVGASAGGSAALGMPEAEALVQLSLSRRALADGHAQLALDRAHRAVAASYGAGQPRLQWQGFAAVASAHAAAGRLQEAVFFGKLALARLQSQRVALQPLGSAADARYLSDKSGWYRQVSQWLLALGRIGDALEVMRLLKQYEQAQFTERASAGELELSFTERERVVLRRLLAQLEGSTSEAELRRLNQLASGQRITDAEKERLLQLQQGEAALREARLALLNELGRSLESRDGAQPAKPRLRPPDGTLHAYLLAGERQLSIVLLGRRHSRVVQVPMSMQALAEQIASLRDATQARADVQVRGEALYRQLGHPVAQAAQAERAGRIVLWLDGPLRYLPFGLLHDGHHYLAASYRLVLAGSTGAGEPRPARGADKRRPALAGFGVTQALAGLPALPAVADELCGIVAGPVLGLDPEGWRRCGASAQGRGPWPGEARLNAHFTEAALREATLNGAADQLLHIGTHFVLRPGQIHRSWLLLGDGSKLQLARIRELAWGRTQLITLSACETAVADSEGSGREVDGLAASLLSRGARQLLASLWRVDDQATARFMQDFYSRYARSGGTDAAAALQAAQRQAMARGEPAHHWAAFVLIEATQPATGVAAADGRG
ncbi:CHAT domain-containing protein [Paucibacter sp. APW11]|uniref:CHAT domain-containing protein n=1 Tax=Roseateles aquae TaxID=3077235 RepID=A0ABU3PE11_9BURK|nr:CHAT domain-containing protein [Paucibacter sp. APW11]MDT9000840.1 CHAT domain-containing protein [Paucibacter sp. APW11]